MACPFSGKKSEQQIGEQSGKPEYFHPVAYVLSRYAFVATHLSFAYSVFAVANDPLDIQGLTGIPITTLDAKNPSPAGTALDYNALLWNIAVFLFVWWIPHSGLARTAVKKLIGLLGHPLDRPIFAAIAGTAWGLSVYLWKPIDTVNKFDVFNLEPLAASATLTTFSVASFFILSLLYILPHHVFGTSSHKFSPGYYDPHEQIIVDFPYGLSRHPAAAGFFYLYFSLIALYFTGYTTINQVVLASLWIVFIVTGTLVFEERGIKEGKDAFSLKYLEYHARTGFLIPTLYSVKRCLGLTVKPYSWEKKDQKKTA